MCDKPLGDMVKHQIVMQRAEIELTLTLLDNKLIILQGQGETKTRIDQEFPSEAALVEHALRVVKLRQQEGFRVIGERKADQVVLPAEPATDEDPAAKENAVVAKAAKAVKAALAKAAAGGPVGKIGGDDDDAEDDDE